MSEILRALAFICFVLAPLCFAGWEMLKAELMRPKSRYDIIKKYEVRDFL